MAEKKGPSNPIINPIDALPLVPLGIGLRSYLQKTKFSEVWQAGQPIQSVADPVRQVLAGVPASEVTKSYGKRAIRTLEGLAEDLANPDLASLPGTLTKDTLVAAAAHADPSGAATRLINKRIAARKALNSVEIVQDVIAAFETSPSVHLRRTAALFADNLQMLRSRQLQGLPLEFQALESRQIGKAKRIRNPRALGNPIISQNLREIKRLLGGQMRVVKHTRPELEGGFLEVSIRGSKKLGKFMGNKEKPQLSFKIPLAFGEGKTLVRGGRTLQSLYAAGQFADISFDETLNRHVIKGLKSYDEWVSSRALDDLVIPLMEAQKNGDTITQRTIRAQLAHFRQSTSRRKDWMLPPDLHQGSAEYLRARSQILRGFEGGQPVSAATMSSILSAGGVYNQSTGTLMPLFPGHSATQMAHGVFSTTDWGPQTTLFPGAWPHEKPILQPLRKEWALTPEGLERLQASKAYQRYKWAAPGGPFAPTAPLKTMFIGGRDVEKLSKAGYSPEGMIWIHREALLPMQEAMTPIKVKQLAPEFAEAVGKMQWSINRMVPAGTVLGYGLDGEAITLKQETALLEVIRHKDRASSDYMVFHGVKKVDYGRYAAFWNLKSMGQLRSTAEMNEALKTLGMPTLRASDKMQAGIESIVPLADLTKNQAIFQQQMSTSIWEHLKRNYEESRLLLSRSKRGFTKEQRRAKLRARFGPEVEAFVRDPRSVLESLEAEASSTGTYRPEVFYNKMTALAQQGRLRAGQMGEVFGGFPAALKMDTSSEAALQASWKGRFGMDITKQAARSILEERPVSYGQFFIHGGPGAQGVGKQGTIEPRMIELLRGPHWGGIGKDLEMELAERMGARYPQRVAEQGILGQSLMSLVEPGKLEGAAYTPEEILGMSPEARKAAMQEGFNLRINKFGDVIVPAEGTLKQLASYKTSTGEVVRPDLARGYQDFIQDAASFTRKDVNREIFGESVGRLQQEIGTAYTRTFSGLDALGRGRVPGSRYLTSVAYKHEEALGANKLNVNYISRQSMEGMVGELEDLYGSEYAEKTLKTFEAGGEVPGLRWRHPGVGPYSVEPTLFKMMPGVKDDVLGVPEYFQKARWRAEGGEFQDLPNQLRLSNALPLAEDFDKDASTSMVAGPNTKGKVEQLLADPQWNARNVDYQIQRQLLIPKRTGGPKVAPTIRELMGSAAGKLRIPKESLGLLSTELTTTKAALLMTAGSAEQTLAAQTFLEWWEQTPISGKHLQTGKESELPRLIQQATHALRTSDAPTLMDLTRKIIGEEGMTGVQGALLNEGIQVETPEGIRKVRGLDWENTLNNMMERNRAFRQAPAGSLAGSTRRRIETKGLRSTKEVMGYLESQGKSSFEAWLPRPTRSPKMMSSVVQKVNSLRNRAAAMGGKLLEHARPLALGFAAAVGLATVLSRPGKSLEETDMIPPAPSTQGGTGGANIGTNIHPQSYMQGSPSTPNPLEGVNGALISPGQPSRFVIQGNSPGNTNYTRLSQQLAAVGPTSTQIQDNRRSLTPQKMADILQRG